MKLFPARILTTTIACLVLLFLAGNVSLVLAQKPRALPFLGCDKAIKVESGGVEFQIPCDTTAKFAGWFLEKSIAVAGTAAVLLIVVGGYYVMMSRGDPGRINKGRELITNAIIGLLFIILSAVILRFIGHEMLGIPLTDRPSSAREGGGRGW